MYNPDFVMETKKLWKYMLLSDGEINQSVEFSYIEKEADLWSIE